MLFVISIIVLNFTSSRAEILIRVLYVSQFETHDVGDFDSQPKNRKKNFGFCSSLGLNAFGMRFGFTSTFRFEFTGNRYEIDS